MKNLLQCYLVWVILLNGFMPAFANQPDEKFLSNVVLLNHARHIALLLPLESSSLEQAALAVQKGFVNAAKLSPEFTLEIIPYPTDGNAASVLSAYQQAVNNGAEMVIGPLARNGVDALASSQLVSLPTLALNYTTGRMTDSSAQLFFFGLSVEAEAQDVARMAAVSGRHHAVILADRRKLSKRLKTAFADAWLEIDPDFSAEDMEISARKELSMLSGHSHNKDNIIFLALNSFNSQAVRPFIHKSVPVYATSIIFNSKDSMYFQELEAVRFMDMPWLVQPELASIRQYYSPDMPTNISLQRFYALGIDAFRLTLSMFQQYSPGTIMLDGVSGFILLDVHGHFNRRPIPAIFRQGEAVPDH
ncbi:MAG: penicillin-binding protein activator [Nitrosomonas sp.]|nr:penicillin-binding protein activator [Nitrosomonas sp.]